MVADLLDQLAVADDVRPRDVERAAGRARDGRGARERLDHVALVDRLGAIRAPGRQRDEREALDQAHEEAERARAGADHDRGAQRDRVRQLLEQHALDREPAREVGRRRRVARDEPAEVDDPPHAGRPRRGGEALGGDALAGAEVEGGGSRIDRRLHRVDQEVGDVDPVERCVEPCAADRVADDERHAELAADAPRVAREAAQLVAVAQQARHEPRADEAADAGDEDPHRPLSMTTALPAAAGGKGPQIAGGLSQKAKKIAVLQAFRRSRENSCDLREATLSRGTASAYMAAPDGRATIRGG